MRYIPLADGRKLDLMEPLVMGVINCTPDSFADRSETSEKAIELARQMIDEGADILDIGGESSRPGSEPVSFDVELERIMPVVESIRRYSDIPLSIDTYKAVVAKNALAAGVDIINDISALGMDDDMAGVVAGFECPVILMHMKGTPKTMQDCPHYDDVLKEIAEFFEKRINYAKCRGVSERKIILDPGIGFGKRRVDNLVIIKHLSEFKRLGRPLMLGASRKRFIGEITGKEVDKRVDGSLAVAALAVLSGADIIRAHDVARTKDAAAMAVAVREV
jgi:dihydropteroate synthase